MAKCKALTRSEVKGLKGRGVNGLHFAIQV